VFDTDKQRENEKPVDLSGGIGIAVNVDEVLFVVVLRLRNRKVEVTGEIVAVFLAIKRSKTETVRRNHEVDSPRVAGDLLLARGFRQWIAEDKGAVGVVSERILGKECGGDNAKQPKEGKRIFPVSV